MLGFGCVPRNSCVFKTPVFRVRTFGGDWVICCRRGFVLKELSGSFSQCLTAFASEMQREAPHQLSCRVGYALGLHRLQNCDPSEPQLCRCPVSGVSAAGTED